MILGKVEKVIDLVRQLQTPPQANKSIQEGSDRAQQLEKLCSIYSARIDTMLQLLKSRGLYGALQIKAPREEGDELELKRCIRSLINVVRLKDCCI